MAFTLNPRKIWLRHFKRKPHFEFLTDGVPDEHGLMKMDMEWNKAFMKNIRVMGFTGHTEEECVQGFLGSLFLGMAGANADNIPSADPNVQPSISTDGNNRLIK